MFVEQAANRAWITGAGAISFLLLLHQMIVFFCSAASEQLNTRNTNHPGPREFMIHAVGIENDQLTSSILTAGELVLSPSRTPKSAGDLRIPLSQSNQAALPTSSSSRVPPPSR